MFDLSGMTALVTGASGGIGSAIARALVAQGARVALSGTREDALKAVAAEIGGDTVIVPCDLGDPQAVDGLVPRAVEALAQATQWVVEKFPGDPNAVAAVSVPYLKLWGIVAGGWLMGRAAELCANKLTAGAADADFCKTKIATARFYVEHILPQAAALAEEITSGASSVLGFGEAQF